MDIPINVEVSCQDGPFGRSTYIILHPSTKEITHIVVRDFSLAGVEYLVPIHLIAKSTPNHIMLRGKLDAVGKLDLFRAANFIPAANVGAYGPYPAFYWPMQVSDVEILKMNTRHIPSGEMAVRRGAPVFATDGRIGHIDEFLINPIDDKITHMVVREGHLWDQKELTLPIELIIRIEEEAVYLNIDKAEIAKLPSVPMHQKEQI